MQPVALDAGGFRVCPRADLDGGDAVKLPRRGGELFGAAPVAAQRVANINLTQ